jgi:alkanesulfonate monooxygenase SsuD/methylene tetrahydromethanopterin reductase-like flavin-dependent oxidoreductase (luciferase family)
MQPGSIGLGLYLLDLPVIDAVDQLVAQAVLAEKVGFDGATVSEHHGGFRSYLPNPLLAASWILASTKRIWSGPNPLLLPLRDVPSVAEDLAWLDARFPGRVAAGLAAGYHQSDFDIVRRSRFEMRGRTFGDQLLELSAILRGDDTGPISNDHAVAGLGEHAIPLMAAAGSPAAARRAANARVGILLDSLSQPEELGRIVRIYGEAGGTGPRVLGRRVWIGEPPIDLFESQLAAYQTKAATSSYLQSATTGALLHGLADQVVEQLLAAALAAQATALVLRTSLPGLDPAAADDQIRGVAEDVLPVLRHEFLARQDV